MALGTVRIGQFDVSRLIIGGNPFSGFSHQSPERDLEMLHYYSTARIKATLAEAERLGINTFIGRADRHILRVLAEYWDEGGAIQWIAQTCPEYAAIERSIESAARGGARACYLHGGQMDHFFLQGRLDEVALAIARIREAGLAVGIAGHEPKLFEWAERELDVGFYMCSYYNPTRRHKRAQHVYGDAERFAPEDREAMVAVISRLSRPAIHYKVLAAGRNDPREAFRFVARHLRPQDAVCIGVYTKHNAEMLEEDLEIAQELFQSP